MRNISRVINVVRPTAVIWDWDGTIVKFRESQFLASMNFALTSSGGSPLKDLSGSNSVRETLKTEHAYRLFIEHFMSFSTNKDLVAMGAEVILKYFYSKGVLLSVVSNLDHRLLMNDIEKLGFFKYFNSIRGSKCAEELKPSPLMMLEVITMLPLEARHRVWGVGDSAGDVVAAKAAGMFAIHIGSDAPRIKEVKPDLVFTDLFALRNYMEELQGRGK